MNLVTRYPNRKLYLNSQSRYGNLDDLKEFILNGEQFSVIDHRSKKDLTRQTLKQMVFKKIKEDTINLKDEQLVFMIIGNSQQASSENV